MSDSKIITPDSPRGKNLKPLKFLDLSEPVPTAPPRGSNFRLADYIEGRAGKHDFAPSFGAGQKKAAAKKAPPTPEELLAQAQAQAEAIREQARTEGLQNGHQQAEEEIQTQTARLVEASKRLLSAAEEISRLRSDLLTETEGEIVDLVVLAASKVVNQEIKTNRGVVAGIVTSALEELRQGRSIRIRLNPEDLGLIEEMKPDLAAEHPQFETLELEADPDVPAGGCLIESEAEEIDSTPQARLASLGRVMDRALKGLADES